MGFAVRWHYRTVAGRHSVRTCRTHTTFCASSACKNCVYMIVRYDDHGEITTNVNHTESNDDRMDIDTTSTGYEHLQAFEPETRNSHEVAIPEIRRMDPLCTTVGCLGLEFDSVDTIRSSPCKLRP